MFYDSLLSYPPLLHNIKANEPGNSVSIEKHVHGHHVVDIYIIEDSNYQ